MINEHTYFIGMTVISYLVSLFLFFGMIYIVACKEIVEDEKEDDATKLGANFILNEFYESDYITKIVTILKFGAMLTSAITTDILKRIFKGGK